MLAKAKRRSSKKYSQIIVERVCVCVGGGGRKGFVHMLEAQIPTPNPKITKKHLVCTNSLESPHELFSASCHMSQEPNKTCSEKLVQMNFYFGWISWGGFS